MSLLRFTAVTLTLPALLLAASLSSAPSDASLVIYNAGIGLVHEQRALTLDKGMQSIVYPGVATTVQTDSVNVKLPGNVTLYSQQYRFDKITLNKLLEAHIGKTVRFRSGPDDAPLLREGVLLATDPAVVRTDKGIESGIDAQAFIFDAIPDTLIMKPSLVWNVAAERAAKGEMSLDYLISNIGWKSDYVLKVDGDRGDLSGWITVDNRSGKRFEAINLHLLAGEINRATPPVRYADVMMLEKTAAAPAVSQQAHEGYHLYTIPFAVTLADREKTQIKFLDRPAHALGRRYDVSVLPPFALSTEQKHAVVQSIELAPFDVPLPAGTVRTYSDADGTTILLGETRLQNTPKNEKVSLTLGKNFDLIAKEKLVERRDDGRYYDATIAYTLTNRSDAKKTVTLTVPGIVSGNGYAVNITTKADYTRPDADTIRFEHTLKAGESKTWEVGYKARKK